MRNMCFAVVIAIAAVGLAAFDTHPAAAAGQPAGARQSRPAGAAAPQPTEFSATDLSAQARLPYRRARTRIMVYPARPLYRQCVDWYAVEPRAAGNTVVPHMQCQWVYR